MIDAKEIKKAVMDHRDEIIRCLVEMVQTPSVTGDEVPVSRVFRRWMEEMGLEVKTYEAEPGRPNLLAEWFGPEKGPRFVFNGHMDVFPPVESDPGMYGPWSGKVTDGKIYGRGTGDMKGGDCAAIMAVKILKELGFEPKGSILLSFMCDEENGSRLGAKYLIDRELLNGDFGICMEPTDCEILTHHGGIYRAYYTYTAEGYHSHAPHPCGSAIDKVHRAIDAVLELAEEINRRPNPLYDPPCLSVTTVHAGTATNLHASKATFSVDRRYIKGETIESVQKEIADVLDRLKEQDPGMEYEVEVQSDRPTLTVPEDSKMVTTMAKAWEEVMGRPAKFRYCQGGTDAASIVKHNGMHMVVCGPTDGLVMAGNANECVEIKDLLSMVELYALTAMRMLS